MKFSRFDAGFIGFLIGYSVGLSGRIFENKRQHRLESIVYYAFGNNDGTVSLKEWEKAYKFLGASEKFMQAPLNTDEKKRLFGIYNIQYF